MTFTANNRYYGGFDFDPYDISSNAEVRLVCGGAAIAPPLFYVTGRKKHGGVTDWTCCDILSKSDKLLVFSDDDFDENDKITVSDMLVKIHDQCGIGVNTGGLSMLINKTFDKDSCTDGLTARRVFEILAEAMCGYWLAVDGTVVFENFGRTVSAAFPTAYTEVDINGSRTFSSVICTDNDEVYIAGSGGAANTLICTSDFASQESADYILGVMLGGDNSYTYRSWSCGKGKADAWLYPGAYQFGDDLLACNSVSMYISASGLYFTASRNAVDEDEVGYTSEVNRQLKRKLEFDKINGNVAITGKGLYLFENGYKQMSADEQKKAKYSFKVEKGVTEFSGALKSKKYPGIALNADLSGFKMQYDDTSFDFEVVIDGDNVTLKEKEKEGG